jgi:hypothetical protein
MTRTIYRPGQIVPTSGQYNVVDMFGRYCGRQITAIRGNVFPPVRPRTVEHGYVLVDVTVHVR